MLTLTEITEYMKSRATAEKPLGGSLKFIFPEGVLYIDGSGTENQVGNDDKPADCSLKLKIGTFNKIHDHKMDAMVAVFLGKIKVKGDSLLALKIKSLI